ncbi:Hydroxyacylglutathione hydrolase [Clarias magur]|uniref:Hydroxyacylglutathione hydrolase n=1 Tax=Clarias magur TaxID=1594786 RepID=A0A8J4U1Q2_CLAMG|nr:Hydroxyacylglutathione hydrolase [Clarias magur]
MAFKEDCPDSSVVYRCGLVFGYDTRASQGPSGLASSSFQQPNQLLAPCLFICAFAKGERDWSQASALLPRCYQSLQGALEQETIFPSSFLQLDHYTQH